MRPLPASRTGEPVQRRHRDGVWRVDCDGDVARDDFERLSKLSRQAIGNLHWRFDVVEVAAARSRQSFEHQFIEVGAKPHRGRGNATLPQLFGMGRERALIGDAGVREAIAEQQAARHLGRDRDRTRAVRIL